MRWHTDIMDNVNKWCSFSFDSRTVENWRVKTRFSMSFHRIQKTSFLARQFSPARLNATQLSISNIILENWFSTSFFQNIWWLRIVMKNKNKKISNVDVASSTGTYISIIWRPITVHVKQFFNFHRYLILIQQISWNDFKILRNLWEMRIFCKTYVQLTFIS